MENVVTNLQIVDNDSTNTTIWCNDEDTSLHPYDKELNHFKVIIFGFLMLYSYFKVLYLQISYFILGQVNLF